MIEVDKTYRFKLRTMQLTGIVRSIVIEKTGTPVLFHVETPQGELGVPWNAIETYEEL